MRFLVAVFTATSTIEVVVGMPEPLWMVVWGATLFAASAVIARGRQKTTVPQTGTTAADGLNSIQQPSFAGQARG